MTTTTNGTTNANGSAATMAGIARVDEVSLTTSAPPLAQGPSLTVVPDPAQGHQQVGTLSAEALGRSIDATADDVLAAGAAVASVAAEIVREASELSEGIRRCGAAFAAHVTEFSRLAQTVSDTMRSTRQHVLGAPPPAGR